MSESKGVIYLIRSKTTGKMYVGQTRRSFNKRWKEHTNKAFNKSSPDYHNHFHRAIRKYGTTDWECRVIQVFTCSSEKLLKIKLDEAEKRYIKYFDTLRNGYNSTNGGDGACGYKWSEETRKKCAISFLKRPPKVYTEEWKQRLRESHTNNPKCIALFNKRKKAVEQIKDGVVINTFDSAGDACKALNYSSSARSDIQKCCRGVKLKCYGYEWKYRQ